jgi:hypothetical protein
MDFRGRISMAENVLSANNKKIPRKKSLIGDASVDF